MGTLSRRAFLLASFLPAINRNMAWNKMVLAEKRFYGSLMEVCTELKKVEAQPHVKPIELGRAVGKADREFKVFVKTWKEFVKAV